MLLVKRLVAFHKIFVLQCNKTSTNSKILLFLEKGSHFSLSWPWIRLYSQGWLQTHANHPFSSSSLLGLPTQDINF